MERTNRNRVQLALILVLFLSLLFSGCTTLPQQEDTLYQVSVLNALLLGEYDGFVSVGTLKNHGDTGIGTFDTLDGEMILVDGVVFKAKADGSVVPVDDSVLVPFAVTTHFVPDVAIEEITSLSDIEGVKSILDDSIAQTTNDFNRFYVAKIHGLFDHVRVRSVPSQVKPYQRLSTIAATQQEYVYNTVEGTIVAFRSPEYVEGINLPGWHLHFISSDATKGGHLLEASAAVLHMGIGDMRNFSLILPDTKSFAAMDIAHDLTQETLEIEGVGAK